MGSGEQARSSFVTMFLWWNLLSDMLGSLFFGALRLLVAFRLRISMRGVCFSTLFAFRRSTPGFHSVDAL